ncbi:hypothetical protein KVV02_007784 [Mortierella alpina]|uniref:Succinate dehydrogenase assembly factor 2, mitochondrial n=1 Tax=Mortierella alpina TaxID=64518 RepID=A0A9P7ZWN9_MORAP|nr:hypothetical protein KVV02_007784 [Mortierella alpina]
MVTTISLKLTGVIHGHAAQLPASLFHGSSLSASTTLVSLLHCMLALQQRLPAVATLGSTLCGQWLGTGHDDLALLFPLAEHLFPMSVASLLPRTLSHSIRLASTLHPMSSLAIRSSLRTASALASRQPTRPTTTMGTLAVWRSFSTKPTTTTSESSMPPRMLDHDDARDIDPDGFQTPYTNLPPLPRDPDESLQTIRARLTYQARKRGILETDLLLSTFAKEFLGNMTIDECRRFDKFLDEPDWDIYYWVTGKKEVPERWKGDAVFEKIVKHAKNEGRVVRQMPAL